MALSLILLQRDWRCALPRVDQPAIEGRPQKHAEQIRHLLVLQLEVWLDNIDTLGASAHSREWLRQSVQGRLRSPVEEHCGDCGPSFFDRTKVHFPDEQSSTTADRIHVDIAATVPLPDGLHPRRNDAAKVPDVCLRHFSDIPPALTNVRCRG